MQIHRLGGALVAFFCVSSLGFADTLTFVAQWDPVLGATNFSWFSAANWWVPDAEGKLVEAYRVPTASEGAIITGFADAAATGVRVQSLTLTNSAVVANGTVAVERLEMLSGSAFKDARVNVLTLARVGGTNCLLDAANLNILSIGSGWFNPVAPAAAATLLLERGSLLWVAGRLSLADGSQINTLGAPQSSLILAQGGVLTATNHTRVRGSVANPLLIDNSGLIESDNGTLAFEEAIDWRSSAGAGEFRAGTADAHVLFTSPMRVPANVTSFFTGPGTNRFQAGATIDGVARVGAMDDASQYFLTGNLVVDDSVNGAGSVHVLGSPMGSAALTWNNGTFSLPGIDVDNGARMDIAGGPATTRRLSGCSIVNQGLCVLVSPDVSMVEGGSIKNLAGGVFEVRADGTFSGAPMPGGAEFSNAGTFRKLTPGVTVFGTTDPPQGPDFNNTGLVDIQVGELRLFGGISAGEFRTADGAALWFWGGTQTLGAGSAFTGAGSVRVWQGVAPTTWRVTGAIAAENVELGPNGVIAGPGKEGPALIRLNQLAVRDTGMLTNGSFAVQKMQMLDHATVANSAVTIVDSLAMSGTNCTLSGALLRVEAASTARLGSDLDRPSAALRLVEGAVVEIAGRLDLSDGSMLSGRGLPQSKIIVLPGGILSSTNATALRGDPAGHLLVDNSGIVRVERGTLIFEDGLDWQSSGGMGRFCTVVPEALILFAGVFHIPAGVTYALAGPGTNRFAAGGTIDGFVQIGFSEAGSPGVAPGNVELNENLGGTGTLRLLGSATETGSLVWRNGTLSLAQVDIDSGGWMLVAGEASSTHELSGCTINNYGSVIWPGQKINAGAGAVLNLMPTGTLDIQQDATLVFNQVEPRMVIASSGTLLKSGGAGETTIDADVTTWKLFEIRAGNLNLLGSLTQNLGQTIVHGGAVLSAPSFRVAGGTVSGTGRINATVVNRGKFAPGAPIGILSVSPDRDYQQEATGSLLIEVAGAVPGVQCDQLAIGGHAQLAGELNLQMIDGFVPQSGQTFRVLTCASLGGAFTRVVAPHPPGTVWVPRYTATNVTVYLANEVTVAGAFVASGAFSFSFGTTAGLSYVVQASDDLNPPAWRTVEVFSGDGLTRTFTEPAEGPRRFYRVQMQ